jgi:hypothetical protein
MNGWGYERWLENDEPTDAELDAIANELADAFDAAADQHRKGE